MGNFYGIIEIVPVGEKRPVVIQAPQNKILVKPGHVADLPQHGIDCVKFGSNQLRRVQPLQQFQRAGSRVAQDLRQIGGGNGS